LTDPPQPTRKPTWVLTKVSNYGTSHPVVARLAAQTYELLKWADLSKEEKDQVYLKYDGLKNRLLKCHEAYGRLQKALAESMEEDIFNEDGTLKRYPHLIGLREEIETILYEAKNYLRDLLDLFEIFFEADFDEASYFYDARASGASRIVKWATERFGEADPFTTMLVNEGNWIEELIRKRNAVEHPGGHSGTLHIHNFERIAGNQFVSPTWHRNEMPKTDIFVDLEVYLENLLTLAEDILVGCIVKRSKHRIIGFVEIPEDQRRVNCPMRITVALNKNIASGRDRRQSGP
jgi:hypothetical protein